MCGIAGIVNYSDNKSKTPVIDKMIQLIRHRGPDSTGFYEKGSAGLGHARLSIIDLNTGDQPVYNEDRSICVVFNGEIFNYPELRSDLIKKGHRFYTETDTEVLVHLYEDHGISLFEKLNGQFAFAIWDENKEELLLGRDRVGIRPLFYHHSGKRFIFASEIKSIFIDETVPRALNLNTLSDIFTCWAPIDASTVFHDVYQIPPGHFGVFSKNGLHIQPYWELTFKDSGKISKSIDEWIDELSALIEDSARIRLRADVPVGAYLSGGIDSTYISSLVRKKFNNHLNTFSVGFSDKRFDESSYQKIAADHIGTNHHIVHCSDEDIGELFPRVIWHTEIPILRTAPVPLFMLSELVRKNQFKVVLTGEGADEVFAGYNIFKEDKVRRFWARNPDSKIRPRLVEKLYPYIFSQGSGKAKVFLEGFFKKDLLQTDMPYYSHHLRWLNTSYVKTFFSKDMPTGHESYSAFTEKIISSLPDDFMSWKSLSRAQYIENKIFLSNYLLSSQGDRMAMGNSVEGRYPFLDYRVIEMGAKVPEEFRLNGLTEKYILKRMAYDHIPEPLVNRPKQPYRAPISHCFFGPKKLDYVDELLSEQSLRETGYFDTKKVLNLVEKCRRTNAALLSERENMAVAGILSTMLVDYLFIKRYPNGIQ